MRLVFICTLVYIVHVFCNLSANSHHHRFEFHLKTIFPNPVENLITHFCFSFHQRSTHYTLHTLWKRDKCWIVFNVFIPQAAGSIYFGSPVHLLLFDNSNNNRHTQCFQFYTQNTEYTEYTEQVRNMNSTFK